MAKSEGALDEELERRTLTNVHNERPSWLAQAHDRLDHAVLDAYRWPADIGADDLLAHLLALNLERASGDAEMLPEYDFRGAVRRKYAARVSTE